MDDQLAPGGVEGAKHGPSLRLAGSRHTQILATLGPDIGKVRMGEALGLVREQQDDVAGLRLLPEQLQAQAGALDRLPVLAVF